jgi:hypothetical protein
VDQHLAGERRGISGGGSGEAAADRHPGEAGRRRGAPDRVARGGGDGRWSRPGQPSGGRGRRAQHGAPVARHRLSRRVVRRSLPDLRHPGRPALPERAAVLLRPGMESGPAGPGAPAARLRVADRLAGAARLRPGRRTGIGRARRARPQDRRRPAVRDRLAERLPVPRAGRRPLRRGPGLPRRGRRPPVRAVRRPGPQLGSAGRGEPRLEAGLRTAWLGAGHPAGQLRRRAAGSGRGEPQGHRRDHGVPRPADRRAARVPPGHPRPRRHRAGRP